MNILSLLAAGSGWVAWLRDAFEKNFVELIFEFEATLIFEAVHIYTNNYFSMDVQVIFNSVFYSRNFKLFFQRRKN